MQIKKTDKISGSIIESINKGDLLPGDKLPSNKVLATVYDASEVTVRKSLSDLQDRGYVNIVERKGTFVIKKANTPYQCMFTIHPDTNINEQITSSTLDSIAYSLIRMPMDKIDYKCVEQRKVLYSDSIPVCYIIDSFIINGKYSPNNASKYLHENQEIINRILESFEVNKKIFIRMNNAENYIYDKLLLTEMDPLICISTYYYTRQGAPIARLKYYVSGENIDLIGY